MAFVATLARLKKYTNIENKKYGFTNASKELKDTVTLRDDGSESPLSRS